jgi:hypothetical protein
MRLAKIKENEELLDMLMFECAVLAVEHALSANETVQVSLSLARSLALFPPPPPPLSLSLCMYMYAFASQISHCALRSYLWR